jgi:hypothetical protein
MFVHDFVAVDRPAIAVVDGFSRLQPSLGPLVLAAWDADRDLWTRLGLAYPDYAPRWPVRVEIGPARVRPDAVVIPILWSSGSDLTRVTLEADLEIAAFSANVTHLHLLGRYAFPPGVDRWSAEASRAHRATVSAIRRFLQMVAEQLSEMIPEPAPTGDDSSDAAEDGLPAEHDPTRPPEAAAHPEGDEQRGNEEHRSRHDRHRLLDADEIARSLPAGHVC